MFIKVSHNVISDSNQQTDPVNFYTWLIYGTKFTLHLSRTQTPVRYNELL